MHRSGKFLFCDAVVFVIISYFTLSYLVKLVFMSWGLQRYFSNVVSEDCSGPGIVIGGPKTRGRVGGGGSVNTLI